MTTASRRARQQVLERWPEAHATRWISQPKWSICTGGDLHPPIGTGPTRAAAWQDAAKKLEGEGK